MVQENEKTVDLDVIKCKWVDIEDIDEGPLEVGLAHESVEVVIEVLESVVGGEAFSAYPVSDFLNDGFLPVEIIALLVHLLSPLDGVRPRFNNLHEGVIVDDP